jgi:uncharacterized Zn finger protein (UPF0148 family)
LPQRGDIIALNESCPQCGTPRIKVLGGKRPWVICLDPDCPTKDEYKQRAANRARAGEAKEAAAASAKSKKPTTKKPAAKKTPAKKKAAAGKKTKTPAAAVLHSTEE